MKGWIQSSMEMEEPGGDIIWDVSSRLCPSVLLLDLLILSRRHRVLKELNWAIFTD